MAAGPLFQDNVHALTETRQDLLLLRLSAMDLRRSSHLTAHTNEWMNECLRHCPRVINQYRSYCMHSIHGGSKWQSQEKLLIEKHNDVRVCERRGKTCWNIMKQEKSNVGEQKDQKWNR
ncbi:hypothetical protein JOB18_034403 [Solea senegalensis]|uniref:Uncharacterized protein n=1 Tax=Solea senegalensis TaxID=28829 RepID=A0AAV6PKX3_SOLSE|nr:hypothetical protein JOB18_034403 [Solea senegalensis]